MVSQSIVLLQYLLLLSAATSFTFPASSRYCATQPFREILVEARMSSSDVVSADEAPTVVVPAFDETETPEDAVISIKPSAMNRLRELRAKKASADEFLILRMGVRNGGCSGLSYVMDFSTEEEIRDDDQIDEYPKERIKCVVDAKSLLYLYGLELDYSEELIGGGFKVRMSCPVHAVSRFCDDFSLTPFALHHSLSVLQSQRRGILWMWFLIRSLGQLG